MTPNGERSHAEPRAPDCNRDALPALADTPGWPFGWSCDCEFVCCPLRPEDCVFLTICLPVGCCNRVQLPLLLQHLPNPPKSRRPIKGENEDIGLARTAVVTIHLGEVAQILDQPILKSD